MIRWPIIIHNIYAIENYIVKIHHDKDDNLSHINNDDDDLSLISWLHEGFFFNNVFGGVHDFLSNHSD